MADVASLIRSYLRWQEHVHAAFFVLVRDNVVHVFLDAEGLPLLRVRKDRIRVVLITEHLMRRDSLPDIRLIAHAPLKVEVLCLF